MKILPYLRTSIIRLKIPKIDLRYYPIMKNFSMGEYLTKVPNF